MALTPAQVDVYRKNHLPYVLGVMRGHKKLTDQGAYLGDADILNSFFVGSLAAGRMLLNFVGIALDRKGNCLKPFNRIYDDDVTMEDIGGRLGDTTLLNTFLPSKRE
jgi:hypothetical protein